jgi:predicted Zn-dependent protease
MCQSCLTRRAFVLSLPAALAVAGCDEAPDLVSDEQMAEMGAQSWAQIRAQVPLAQDAGFQRVADAVAGRLLSAAGQPAGGWEVAVFDSPEVNAFALPGGKIGVYRGMFAVAENADQLATVIGHEIGHLQEEHAKARVQAQIVRDIGIRALTQILNAADVEYAPEIGAALGIGVEYGLIRPYGREQEREADARGIALMAGAGFDPRAAVAFWQRMQARDTRREPAFLSTHPAPADRAERIADLIATL